MTYNNNNNKLNYKYKKKINMEIYRDGEEIYRLELAAYIVGKFVAIKFTILHSQ